jgi:hypothetical protein
VVFGAVIIGGMLISGDRIIKGIDWALRDRNGPRRGQRSRPEGTEGGTGSGIGS